MRILLYSNLYSPEATGIGVYSGGLAEALAARGHEVSVIAANPSYPHWRLFDDFPAWGWTTRTERGVVVHRCPVYVPARPSGATRILHYLSFALAAVVPSIRQLLGDRPDLIIHAVPTLMAAPLVLGVGRLSGAATWLHVQDFEVEAGFATGQMQGHGALASAAMAFERWAINGYSKASSISPEMCRKLVEKGRAPASVYELRNWADVDQIVPQASSSYRDRWMISTPHVALYSGSIARKQGIEIILEAAKILAPRGDVTFIICGNGPDRALLEASAATIPNVQIHDLQPKEALGDLLSLATVHLLPQLAGAADLVLPSKLTNMLASGRPVVATAAAGTGLAREIEGCGVVTVPGDADAFATAIADVIDGDDQYAVMAAAARARAEDAWHRDRIIDRFEQEILALVERATG